MRQWTLATLQLLSVSAAALRETNLLISATASLRAPAPAAAFTVEDYLRDPSDISAVALPAFTQQHVVLHFHGRGGPDREDADLKARILVQDKAAGLSRFVHVFVWREYLEAATAEAISYTGQSTLTARLGHFSRRVRRQ